VRKTVSIEDTVSAMGVDKVVIVDPTRETEALEKAVTDALASNDLTVIIARRPCVLAITRDAKLERGEKVR
jgi:indolepyruvate ferredoxin oxidoreductase alpha subunit